MDRKEYRKNFLSFAQQIQLLKNRGLDIENPANSELFISYVNYYRLSNYWGFYYNNKLERFAPSTSFEDIIVLYDFDKKLRLLLLDAIEALEVAVKTRLAYYAAQCQGVFAFESNSLFAFDSYQFNEWINRLHSDIEKSKEPYILEYKMAFNDFPTVPTWIAVETMTLGTVSYLYSKLTDNACDRLLMPIIQKIASDFKQNRKRFESTLHMLSYVRNLCAHHCYLWNRNMTIAPRKSNSPKWRDCLSIPNNNIFYIILIIIELNDTASLNREWARKISDALECFGTSDFDYLNKHSYLRDAMGMPANWKRILDKFSEE